ncbi:MAG TPA: GNAT family N-acetyltransferase [Caulobacteraceae bacterium]|nr:GNAT family N-acetyltransferase [Caulobacteraceae bacterium]
MRIEISRPSGLSIADQAVWSALQDADQTLDSPFLSPGWAQAVERAQVDDRGEVLVAVLRDGGAVRGFFPARVTGFTAMAAGAPMSDYQALVSEPGVPFSPRQLIDALGVHRFDFPYMLADQAPFTPYMRGRDASYVLDLSEGYAAYAAGRRADGSGLLKDLDKRRRKVEREVGPVVFTAHSRSRTDFDRLIAWKQAQMHATGQTDIFQTGWIMRLMRDLFVRRDPDFGAVLFTLHIGGVLAAAHFDLRGRHTVHAWIIAHDPAFERYSPGLMLFQDIARWMDQTPFQILDLGAGDYRFKQQLANTRRMVAHGFVGRPSPLSLLRQAQYGVRDAAERLPLGRISALPGKAMRRLDQWRGLR